MKNPLLFAAFAACCLWLAACNESPTSAFGDLIDDQARDDAYWEAKNDCTNKGGTWDSWYNECSYRSSSSYYYYSSSSAYYYTPTTYGYTTTQKTMYFTMTYYRQTTSNWDVLDDAGDPKISFKIVFTKKDGSTSSSWITSLYRADNSRSWSGRLSATVTVPVYTSSIYVYPEVIDVDISDNDNKSSGYGYGVNNVGYLDNYEVKRQSDTNASQYSLEWEWYLY